MNPHPDIPALLEQWAQIGKVELGLMPDEIIALGDKLAACLRTTRDFDAVCTRCRWKGDHAPDCPLRDQRWPMIEVDEPQSAEAALAAFREGMEGLEKELEAQRRNLLTLAKTERSIAISSNLIGSAYAKADAVARIRALLENSR